MNKWAFLISIKKMDPNVEKYNKALENSSMKKSEILILHCKYYFAFRKVDRLKNSLNHIMDEPTNELESINFIIECLFWLKDPCLTRKFIIKNKKVIKIMKKEHQNKFKKILYPTIIDIILKTKDKINE